MKKGYLPLGAAQYFREEKEEYPKKKEEQKQIYLSKVSSLIRGGDFRKIIIEAEEKFENEYPRYQE